MKEKIRTFIIKDILGRGSDFELSDHEDILGSGLIDSMGIVRLIGYIEEEFGIKVPPGEMVIDNFQSLDKIEEYITKRQ